MTARVAPAVRRTSPDWTAHSPGGRGGSGDPPVRTRGSGARQGSDAHPRRDAATSGGTVVDRWPSASRGSSAERHRTRLVRPPPAGGADQGVRPYGAVDEADPLDRRRRHPPGSPPGARRLRVSASSVTRGVCARRSSTGAGRARERRDETEHTPATTEARRLPHAPDARPPATCAAIDVTPGRGGCASAQAP